MSVAFFGRPALQAAYGKEKANQYSPEQLRRNRSRNLNIYNLPAQLTPLIGREQELQAVGTLLCREEMRLVTLTGTGGVGKTRLGLQVAIRLQNDFVDGVCFVPLASISDPMVVVPTIAQTLGIKEARERPLMDLLQASLRDKSLLLLLDNFEQVVAAAPQLSDLLARCPHLKLLVTSRAVLRVQGEHEFPVLPLALPDLAHLPESEALWQYAAITLFLQRSQAAKPDFQLTPTNAQAIAEICVRLDGLPLAIELAAARIKLLPPQALLARLKYRLQVLTNGAQDVQARQQTLRNTLAWSYNLLSAEEQRLFRRLCVFASGSTLAAVEAVYRDLDDMPASVLDGVASLIDKSLLQQTEQEGEEPRFQMLETIRDFGLEVLATSGETESTRRAHAAYYVALAEEAEPELLGPQQAAWLDRLEREHDNLRAALQWTLEQAEAGDSIEIALRLGGTLRQWWVHGHCPEGRTFLERALVRSEGIAAPLRAKVLIAAAHLAFFQGDYDRIETLCKESLALYRELGDQAGIASSLFWLGSVARARDNTAVARSFLMEALALAKTVDDKARLAWYLFNLALVESSQGEYARARALYEESLAIHRNLGNKRGIVHTLSQLAQLLLVSQSDQAKVPALLEECLAVSREVGIKEMIAASYCFSGQLALSQGDLVTAHSLVEKSVVLCKEVGYRHGTAESLFALGKVLATQGYYAAARTQYEESYAISRVLGERSMIAACLVELGEVAALQRQFAWAAQLWGAAEALREATGVPILPVERADYEHAVAAARIQLGEQAFSAAWAQGRTKTPEQALADQGQLTDPAPTTSTTPPPNYPAGLTAREVEVLRLVARGLTTTQIAQELVLSEKTINTHLTHIFTKTSTENRAAATAFAIRHGLV